jgi:hypothetical protein
VRPHRDSFLLASTGRSAQHPPRLANSVW